MAPSIYYTGITRHFFFSLISFLDDVTGYCIEAFDVLYLENLYMMYKNVGQIEA